MYRFTPEILEVFILYPLSFFLNSPFKGLFRCFRNRYSILMQWKILQYSGPQNDSVMSPHYTLHLDNISERLDFPKKHFNKSTIVYICSNKIHLKIIFSLLRGLTDCRHNFIYRIVCSIQNSILKKVFSSMRYPLFISKYTSLNNRDN